MTRPAEPLPSHQTHTIVARSWAKYLGGSLWWALLGFLSALRGLVPSRRACTPEERKTELLRLQRRALLSKEGEAQAQDRERDDQELLRLLADYQERCCSVAYERLRERMKPTLKMLTGTFGSVFVQVGGARER